MDKDRLSRPKVIKNSDPTADKNTRSKSLPPSSKLLNQIKDMAKTTERKLKLIGKMDTYGEAHSVLSNLYELDLSDDQLVKVNPEDPDDKSQARESNAQTTGNEAAASATRKSRSISRPSTSSASKFCDGNNLAPENKEVISDARQKPRRSQSVPPSMNVEIEKLAKAIKENTKMLDRINTSISNVYDRLEDKLLANTKKMHDAETNTSDQPNKSFASLDDFCEHMHYKLVVCDCICVEDMLFNESDLASCEMPLECESEELHTCISVTDSVSEGTDYKSVYL